MNVSHPYPQIESFNFLFKTIEQAAEKQIFSDDEIKQLNQHILILRTYLVHNMSCSKRSSSSHIPIQQNNRSMIMNDNKLR